MLNLLADISTRKLNYIYSLYYQRSYNLVLISTILVVIGLILSIGIIISDPIWKKTKIKNIITDIAGFTLGIGFMLFMTSFSTGKIAPKDTTGTYKFSYPKSVRVKAPRAIVIGNIKYNRSHALPKFKHNEDHYKVLDKHMSKPYQNTFHNKINQDKEQIKRIHRYDSHHLRDVKKPSFEL